MKTAKKITKADIKAQAYTPEELWINPVGGLGDTLMLSGVLKMVYDANPAQKFNLVRRTKYLSILKGHPAIDKIGNPPKGAKLLRTDYWAIEKLGAGNQRPFQILARAYGLQTPVNEELFLPGGVEEDTFLEKVVPWKERNIIIAPASDSPRKMMHPVAWHILTDLLAREGCLVIQAGKMTDLYIKGSYSLLGITSPRQLIALVKRCDAVVTTDSFVMHSAFLTKTPAVVLWGPTKADMYGYPGQIHLSANLDHCHLKDQCLGPEFSQNYPTPCPLEDKHCMSSLRPEDIFRAVQKLV